MKRLELHGTSVVKQWTITGYSVVPPKLPPPLDGSASVQVRAETIVNGDTVSSAVTGQSWSAERFYSLWNDIAGRMKTAIDAGADPAVAYQVATRDGLYAALVADGVIPPDAD